MKTKIARLWRDCSKLSLFACAFSVYDLVDAILARHWPGIALMGALTLFNAYVLWSRSRK